MKAGIYLGKEAVEIGERDLLEYGGGHWNRLLCRSISLEEQAFYTSDARYSQDGHILKSAGHLCLAVTGTLIGAFRLNKTTDSTKGK